MHVIQPARLEWRGDQLPYATDFGDGYFSRNNGIAETRHVFLQGNQLPGRWKSLREKHFVIGETGFGTGLNFLCAWELWLQNAPANSHLYYVSAELHPLRREDLARASQLWPELQGLYPQLLTRYPSLTPGFHVLHFERVTLLLLLGDATDMFQQLLRTTHPDFLAFNAVVDAWFLDGFAPAKNPALWTPALLQTLALLSRPGSTAATFSAAGEVRRHLEASGFRVSKQKGYGHKREMITAVFHALPDKIVPDSHRRPATPWSLHTAPDGSPTREVTVLGAGIAGCTLASTLANRGFIVTVIDSHAQAAREASGNLQAVLYGKFSAGDDAFARFNLSSYLYALRHYRTLRDQHPALPIHLCGVLQLAWNETEEQRQSQLAALLAHYPEIGQRVDAVQASQLAGIPLSLPGIFFPQAGWIHPAPVCRQLLQHPNIQICFNTTITALDYQTSRWQLYDTRQQVVHRSPQLILACGHQASRFSQTQHLPLKALRGQVSHVTPTATSRLLKTVLSGDGYIAPAAHPTQSIGASYTPGLLDLTVNPEEHHSNLQQLQHYAPCLQGEWQTGTITEGRAHFRTTSPDYFPLCGPVADRSAFIKSYGALRKQANQVIGESGTFLPGLYMCSGLGSRGMSYAPLCAEVVAAYLGSGSPSAQALPQPLPQTLMQALHPARFIIRDLIRHRA